MTAYQELQTEHERLLTRQAGGAAPAELLPEVQAYLKEIETRSEEVPFPRDRDQLRANLRFWASFVYDQTGTYPGAKLRPVRLLPPLPEERPDILPSFSPSEALIDTSSVDAILESTRDLDLPLPPTEISVGPAAPTSKGAPVAIPGPPVPGIEEEEPTIPSKPSDQADDIETEIEELVDQPPPVTGPRRPAWPRLAIGLLLVAILLVVIVFTFSFSATPLPDEPTPRTTVIPTVSESANANETVVVETSTRTPTPPPTASSTPAGDAGDSPTEIPNSEIGEFIPPAPTLGIAAVETASPSTVLDLSDEDLAGADFFRGDLQGANLSGANLRGADLRGANLLEADLRGADLSRADLRGAYLLRADLRGANLGGADLRAAVLHQAIVDDQTRLDPRWRLVWELANGQHKQAPGAALSDADLREVDLSGANLAGADLSRAVLAGISFSRANLAGANLSGADLSGADLSGANLEAADLRRADLRRAFLSFANLRRANLAGAQLQDAILSAADWAGATLPDGSISPE